MKQRMIACALILAAILALTWYSDAAMDHFTETVELRLSQAEAALNKGAPAAAMQALAQSIELCRETRNKMTHFWRIEDLTELEASLEASLVYLKQNASEEAAGELRRAVVQVRSLARLTDRLI